jgi:hypothetical protein
MARIQIVSTLIRDGGEESFGDEVVKFIVVGSGLLVTEWIFTN